MKNIYIETASPYYVHIGQELLKDSGSYISQICKSSKAAVISDSNVFPLWGKTVSESLTNAGYQVCSYVFPAGENSKNGNTYLEILNFLAKNKLTRSDIVIALGGGVVGDITGFAAATYLRGIPYVQIPTTLLAMVDSSVGGKTAIDLPAGKNLAGAFYQPKLVLCSLDTLTTLPKSIFCDGCAEVIKYSILYDKALFQHLSENGLYFDQEYVISRCVELKRDVVNEDEFDTGIRQMLNLGHTVGHAIEALSSYTITHGQAVSIGMAIIAKASASRKICADSVYQDIQSLLKQFCLPIETDYDARQLYNIMLSDKKRSDAHINLIVPKSIGQCSIWNIKIETMKSFIEEGL